jgi:hypothetical protein
MQWLNGKKIFIKLSILKVGKSVSVTGRGGPYGCERSRFPHFLNKRLTDGGKVVSPKRRPPCTPQVSFLRFLVLISVSG